MTNFYSQSELQAVLLARRAFYRKRREEHSAKLVAAIASNKPAPASGQRTQEDEEAFFAPYAEFYARTPATDRALLDAALAVIETECGDRSPLDDTPMDYPRFFLGG